jgi:hypothetical protein
MEFKLSPFEKLDYVLSLFYDEEEGKTKELFYTEIVFKVLEEDSDVDFDIDEGLLYEIIMKLVDDKFIEIVNEDFTIQFDDLKGAFKPNMKMTFEGYTFYLSRGYVGKYEKENSERRKAKRNEMLLIAGTVLAAIGSLGLLVVEIYKLYRGTK